MDGYDGYSIGFGFSFLPFVFLILQFAWFIWATIRLQRIWKKVKNLPE